MPDWDALMAQATLDQRQCVVGALIPDGRGHLFVHRRGWQRRLLPGCWDIVGGHVEADENPLAALEREIAEETGWRLRGSPQLIYVTGRARQVVRRFAGAGVRFPCRRRR